MKALLKSAAAFLAVGCFSLSSYAGDVNDLWIDGINKMEDTDAERILRDGTNVIDGDLQVGDIIETALIWNTINQVNIASVTYGPDFFPPYQFTAYSQLEITQILDNDGSGNVGDVNGDGLVQLVFGATGNLQTADSLIDIYQTNTASENIDISAVGGVTADDTVTALTSQDYMASLGFSDSDDFWFSIAPLDIGDVVDSSGPGSPGAGQATFGLTVLANPGAIPYTTNGIASLGNPAGLSFHDMVGATQVYNPQGIYNDPEDGWTLASNSDISFLKGGRVPAPGSLALLALGLLGAGIAGRRNKAS